MIKQNLLVVLIVIILIFILTFQGGIKLTTNCYNNIVISRQAVDKSLGDLEGEYQRRYAVISNLITIVKEVKEFEKYLVQIEKDVYVETAEAKASATKMDVEYPAEIKKRLDKENQLGQILTNMMDKLMVLAQKFPVINDPNTKERNDTFYALYNLRQELKYIEHNILYNRKCFNEYVRVYNQNISIFPSNIVAKRFDFKALPYFEVLDKDARKDVKISF